MHDLSTTVVAIATPAGRGGVGCVRISGRRSAEITRRLFRAASSPPPAPGERPRFGRFLDREGRPLDHGYLVLFSAESSFTGESSAELWAHGSPAVLAELVEASRRAGALPAGPGEFTYRALRNGRLDVARAEAVRDLVAARTLFQARVAFAQTEGAITKSLAPLRANLEEWIARAEAAVEFVDESETHLPGRDLRVAMQRLRSECDRLLRGYQTGRVVRDGATLVVVGLPNAGKSSIFNSLLRFDRAIVAEVAGTTRDTVEEEFALDGIPVRLVDTAGLRQVDDPVESEGVRRAHRAREEADLVLLVLDGARDPEAVEIEALVRSRDAAERDRTVAALNKCDLPRAVARWGAHGVKLAVSARTGRGIDLLRSELRRRLIGAAPLESPVITNARHADALERARDALDKAIDAEQSGLTEELILEDLKRARRHLGEITGEFTGEALYDRVFSTFCIGK